MGNFCSTPDEHVLENQTSAAPIGIEIKKQLVVKQTSNDHQQAPGNDQTALFIKDEAEEAEKRK